MTYIYFSADMDSPCLFIGDLDNFYPPIAFFGISFLYLIINI